MFSVGALRPVAQFGRVLGQATVSMLLVWAAPERARLEGGVPSGDSCRVRAVQLGRMVVPRGVFSTPDDAGDAAEGGAPLARAGPLHAATAEWGV